MVVWLGCTVLRVISRRLLEPSRRLHEQDAHADIQMELYKCYYGSESTKVNSESKESMYDLRTRENVHGVCVCAILSASHYVCAEISSTYTNFLNILHKPLCKRHIGTTLLTTPVLHHVYFSGPSVLDKYVLDSKICWKLYYQEWCQSSLTRHHPQFQAKQ